MEDICVRTMRVEHWMSCWWKSSKFINKNKNRRWIIFLVLLWLQVDIKTYLVWCCWLTFADMIKLFLFLCAFRPGLPSLHGEECTPNQDFCEYWFIVEEQLTMVDRIQNALVFSRDGKLIRADDNTTEVEYFLILII